MSQGIRINRIRNPASKVALICAPSTAAALYLICGSNCLRNGIFRLTGPADERLAGGQGVWVLGTQDPLNDGQQGSELIAGPACIPRLTRPAGKTATSYHRARMPGTQYPLCDGH